MCEHLCTRSARWLSGRALTLVDSELRTLWQSPHPRAPSARSLDDGVDHLRDPKFLETGESDLGQCNGEDSNARQLQ